MGCYYTDEEKILSALQRHPDRAHEAWFIARSAHLPTARVKEVLENMVRHPETTPPPPTPRIGISLDNFKARHDPRVKIRKVMQAHESVILTDQQMRELCEVSINDWRRFANLEEFKSHQWRWQNVLYWATPTMIEHMKQAVGGM